MISDKTLARRLRKVADPIDQEVGHAAMDDVLIQFLRELGYTESARAYEEQPKWYA